MVHSVQQQAQQSSTVPVEVAIVETVAAADGVDEMALPPLGRVLDVDALENLLDAPGAGTLTVDFEFAGHRIEVAADRTISVDGAEQ